MKYRNFMERGNPFQFYLTPL